jgi:HSP20 family protein
MISRWDPFRDLSVLQDRINRIFNETTRPVEGSSRSWAPVVDILETEGDLIVKAELPGMKREDIDIEITSEALTIKGDRKFDEEQKDNYLRVERPYGPFQRSFTIGVPVDAGKVSATYQDGLLTVVIPKAEEVKPKKIEINTP